MSILERPAKVIRDITTIVGAVVAVSAFFVNVWPETAPGVWLSDKWGKLFNAPSGTIGFVYYEYGSNGSETKDGRLVTVLAKTRPTLDDLVPGQIFRAVSTVRLRSTDTAVNNDNIIDRLGPTDCVVLLRVTREVPKENLIEAEAAAWFEVASAQCALGVD